MILRAFSTVLFIALAVTAIAEDKRRDDLKKPLVLASQGSFFVGGESKTVSPAGPGAAFAAGDITINQMYVMPGATSK